MNGGRLSDDAAFSLGLEAMGRLLRESGDAEATERALGMIAMRYPDDAEQMRGFLDCGDHAACATLLRQVQTQFSQDSDED